MKSVFCPVCNNECSPLAKTCPKCGHPFIQDDPFPSLAESERKPRNYAKYLGISVGLLIVIGIGLVAVFAIFSEQIIALISKSPQEVFLNKPENEKKPHLVPAQSQKGSLKIEAGLIYQADGPQPVSRTEFYLLDTDLNNVLREVGITGKNPYGMKLDPISLLGHSFKRPTIFPDIYSTAMSGIKKHQKYVATTDFQGKATLSELEQETYYLYGITNTRQGFVIWNLRYEVKQGENSVVLDSKNAAFAL